MYGYEVYVVLTDFFFVFDIVDCPFVVNDELYFQHNLLDSYPANLLSN